MVPFSDQMPSATSKTCAGLTKAPRPPSGESTSGATGAKVKSQPCQGGQWALEAGGGAGCGPGLETKRPRGHSPAEAEPKLPRPQEGPAETRSVRRHSFPQRGETDEPDPPGPHSRARASQCLPPGGGESEALGPGEAHQRVGVEAAQDLPAPSPGTCDSP